MRYVYVGMCVRVHMYAVRAHACVRTYEKFTKIKKLINLHQSYLITNLLHLRL